MEGFLFHANVSYEHNALCYLETRFFPFTLRAHSSGDPSGVTAFLDCSKNNFQTPYSPFSEGRLGKLAILILPG